MFLSGVRAWTCLCSHGQFFHTHLHTTCTHSCLSPLLCFAFLFYRIMGFMSLTSTEAPPLTRQRSCSCDLTPHLCLGHINRSAACSSPIVGFTFRGKTQDVRAFRCSKTEKIGQSPRHPGPRPQSNHLLKHGYGWTPNLVGSVPFFDVAVAGDVSPTHKILFLSRFSDPQEGVSVGCIDFSLMPEVVLQERNEGKVR